VLRGGRLGLNGVKEFADSRRLAARLEEDMELNWGEVAAIERDGEVAKVMTRLVDGLLIESVIIPMTNHNTICISCQVGCRMGCRFCETGRMGYYRDLTTEEIVAQVYAARFKLGIDIQNIVFMGMGEPFDNFGNVLQALRVFNDPKGLNFALRHITLSTVGRTDGIRKLAELERFQVNLAVSLNAPNDRIRSKIMPINRYVPMSQLKKALLAYPLKKSGIFFIEYVLIEGVNDAPAHARELARFLKPLPVRVNVIAYNPGSNPFFEAPTEASVDRFCSWLAAEKIFVRRRTPKGRGLMAACGQLGHRPTVAS
jgi:23S rRNA (adenine2503-C2)-methyltransferase